MSLEMVSDRDLSQLSLSEFQQAISAETDLEQLLHEMRRWLSFTVDSIKRLCVLIRRADELEIRLVQVPHAESGLLPQYGRWSALAGVVRGTRWLSASFENGLAVAD